jgi:hypothetical protein
MDTLGLTEPISRGGEPPKQGGVFSKAGGVSTVGPPIAAEVLKLSAKRSLQVFVLARSASRRGTSASSECFHSMTEPLPILIEKAIQIAWDYLERTGQIDDPEITSWLLLDTVEHMVRCGERRRLALSNGAIAAYERLRAESLAA